MRPLSALESQYSILSRTAPSPRRAGFCAHTVPCLAFTHPPLAPSEIVSVGAWHAMPGAHAWRDAAHLPRSFARL